MKDAAELENLLSKKSDEINLLQRELEIEASLEKMRSRSFSMIESDELAEIASICYQELLSLQVLQKEDGFHITLYHIDSLEFENWITEPGGQRINRSVKIPLEEFPPAYKNFQTWNAIPAEDRSGQVISTNLSKNEIQIILQLLSEHPTFQKEPLIQLLISDPPEKWLIYDSFFSHGTLVIDCLTQPINQEKLKVLNRFSKVFEQTYTRFLDLQKAEAQAREAQIEAALERVRARAMSMHESSELMDTSKVLFAELNKSGLKTVSSSITFMRPKQNELELWVTHKSEFSARVVKTSDHPNFKAEIDAWLAKEKFIKIENPKEEFSRTVKQIFDFNLEDRKDKTNFHLLHMWNQFGYLTLGSWDEASQEDIDVLHRFSKVFEQTYTRFLDLQKAETQARQARIEAAIERVRAASMAMHQSSELQQVVQVMFEQMQAFGISSHATLIEIFDVQHNLIDCWFADHLNSYHITHYEIKGKKNDTIRKMWACWKEQQPSMTIHLKGVKKKKYDTYLLTETGFKNIPDALKKDIRSSKEGCFTYCSMRYGLIQVVDVHPIPAENTAIIQRFAKVFEQTYTRFLDLQKAEAQAREAQIEAALERVRARTMGMHHSDELGEASALLDSQVRSLGINTWGCAFNIYGESNSTEWFSSEVGTFEPYAVPRENIFLDYYEAGKKGETLLVKEFADEECLAHYEYLCTIPVAGDSLNEIKEAGGSFPTYQIDHVAYFKYGYLLFITFEPFPEAHDIFKRFAKVFEQTYTRFLDLQKAETQAREAQIEASLERIRTQAMAMRHSDDLIKSTTILFEELEKLELPIERSGIGIFDLETRDCELWSMVVSKDGKKELATGITSMTVHPMLTETFDAWIDQEPVSYTLEGQDLVDYYQLISDGNFHLSQEAIGSSASLPKEYYEYVPFGGGGIYFFSDTKPQEPDKQIMRRFAEVFHLTYTRYQDLQKAESRAKEAIKQASLERVRGEIASMRSKEDLNKITPLVWNELKTLEVPFIRCGVFIINEPKEHVEVYLSSADGQALGALNLAFDSNELTSGTVESWRKQKVFHRHWNQEEFMNWTKMMIEVGQVQNQKTYQGMAEAPESLDLNFVPFTQGMLYVGSTDALKNEEIAVVKSLADSFAIAYARYDDFVKLEKAKESIELTLSELKAAQKQLVQSEKMASLGELTAGIAHEIQNPLNFVNNFSEVSEELVQEIKEERQKTKGERDEDLEEEILTDLEQNLSKINHHGNRASSIVKGMLEHSRTSSGVKQLTDINALADEYLRLSYHGLRAKDKTFNAEIITNFDPNLPKVEVIPQDIGRVLLNLINNAFQAVDEASRTSTSGDEGYKPAVSVSTKLTANSQVLITVKDNGPGIPDEIKDKIFQPFFTTKDTGKGTGLGLSLAYDIVKAHGGEISIKSTQSTGSTFIITLSL